MGKNFSQVQKKLIMSSLLFKYDVISDFDKVTTMKTEVDS